MTSPALSAFSQSTFTHDGLTRDVYQSGAGPAVIIIHEMPGLHPGVLEFGRRVIAAGFTAYLPSLFGTPGRPVSSVYFLTSGLHVCVAREFTVFGLAQTSPIVSWLRALAAQGHRDCGGAGVGAVGMCFTGGFALGMMVDDRMLAPVLSQPALPAPVGARRRASVGLSHADLVRVKERATAGACIMGLRFTLDQKVPDERFATLRQELGDAFIAVEIDSSPGNPYGIPRKAHSVLTLDLVDQPGHPTRVALDRVLDFLRQRLL